MGSSFFPVFVIIDIGWPPFFINIPNSMLSFTRRLQMISKHVAHDFIIKSINSHWVKAADYNFSFFQLGNFNRALIHYKRVQKHKNILAELWWTIQSEYILLFTHTHCTEQNYGQFGFHGSIWSQIGCKSHGHIYDRLIAGEPRRILGNTVETKDWKRCFHKIDVDRDLDTSGIWDKFVHCSIFAFVDWNWGRHT